MNNGENLVKNEHTRDEADSIPTKNDVPEQDKEPTPGCTVFSRCKEFMSFRYLVIIVVGTGMLIMHALRTNVGFTVVTILDQSTHHKVGTHEARMNLPKVDWNSVMVGYLHSSFYVGYLLTHIPAGYLTSFIPSYKLFGASILTSCILNLILPICISSNNYWETCLVRFIQGLVESICWLHYFTETMFLGVRSWSYCLDTAMAGVAPGRGFLYPSCYGVLRHWSTPAERGRSGSAVLAGAYAGAVVGFPVAGVITHYIGWQYVFYANGCVGILFSVIWVWLACEKPANHALISEKELEFILTEQGQDIHDFKDDEIPVKEIFSSLPVLSLCICDFARNWVFILMLTNEPFYLSLFNFTVAENGLYSSIPHIAKVLTAASSGYIADFLLLDSYCTTAFVRKLLTTVGFGTCLAAFFLLTFMTNGTFAMIFLTIAIGFTGFPVSGWQINHYDLSTRHVSLLVGITSTVGNMGSVIVPLITGYITVSHNMRSWNVVFYITCGVLGLAVISYLFCGSGQQQSWATPRSDVVVINQLDPMTTKPYQAEPVQEAIKPKSQSGETVSLRKTSQNKDYGTS